MGNFRITIEAVGGHGCQREKGDGEELGFCEYPGCVDCTARRFVHDFSGKAHVDSAKLEHWPNQDPPGPVDDLKPGGKRSGSF